VKTVRDQAAQEIDAAVEKAATNAEREQLQQGRQSKIDNATAAAEVLTGDPVVVVDNPTYRSEEKMLDDWCRDDEVRATLREAIVVLGELLRGFNENIYKSSKSAADCCES